MAGLLQRGWRPPPLTNDQAQRLLDDMGIVDLRGQTLKLSPQERRVLTLVAYGNTEPGVARVLGRSRETVKQHKDNARAKLAARNTTHAVAIAIDCGLIYSETGWREAA